MAQMQFQHALLVYMSVMFYFFHFLQLLPSKKTYGMSMVQLIKVFERNIKNVCQMVFGSARAQMITKVVASVFSP